jgi:hypothetical protein
MPYIKGMGLQTVAAQESHRVQRPVVDWFGHIDIADFSKCFSANPCNTMIAALISLH